MTQLEDAIKPDKKTKRFILRMPGAFMILFLLTVVAVIATWLIPAGAYSKLSYEPASQELKLVNPLQHDYKDTVNKN